MGNSRFREWLKPSSVVDPRVIMSSEALEWEDCDFQIGENRGCNVEGAIIDGHYLGIQLNDNPLHIKVGVNGAFPELVQPPRCISIHPAGVPLSLRHSSHSRWAGIIIKRSLLDRTAGQPREVKVQPSVRDDLLASLMQALIMQVCGSDPDVVHNKALSETLIKGIVTILGTQYSQAPTYRGGISDHRLRVLRSWVEAHMSDRLTVADMAEQVGLSASHFAREFRRSTGHTPWGFVLDVRITRARELLESGERPGNVALQCGFCDQAHLSRSVRTRYGVSPSKMRRLQTT